MSNTVTRAPIELALCVAGDIFLDHEKGYFMLVLRPNGGYSLVSLSSGMLTSDKDASNPASCANGLQFIGRGLHITING